MDQKKYFPKNAKCVFKGIIHEIWQWEQEMFDGSKQVFEKIKRPSSASVIAVVDDKIIFQEQEQPCRVPFLSLPGGRCDEGEEPIESAKRELLEETGYASDNIILWKEIKMPSTMAWKKHIFVARNCKRVQDPKLENGEKIKNKFISFDELLMISENDKFRDKDLIRLFLHMRLHPEEREEFRKFLFD